MALFLAPGLVTLVVFFTPFTNVLSRPLVVVEFLVPADVIVVLGGGMTRDGSLSDTSLRRARYGAQLFKRGYAPLLLFSTGMTSSNPGAVSEARSMAEVALEMGVPHSAILLEERSTRTAENAVEISRMLRSRRGKTVLLVTHPTHMRRAVAVFRRAGITVGPAPTDGGEDRGATALERATLFFKVSHEYGAWVLYWWRGWI